MSIQATTAGPVIEVVPSGAALGAEVRGVDLTRPLTSEIYDQVEAALARHGVIFFRGQSISEEAQQAFIEWFGPARVMSSAVNTKRIKNEHFFDVSNIGEDDKIMTEDDDRRAYLLANLLWHSDVSMGQPPARVTALHARVLPDDGGPDTQFVDTRIGYERLSDAQKAECEGLMVEHSVRASRIRVGYTDFSGWDQSRILGAVHPLVRTHAGTGRKSLYIGAHTQNIVGWDPEEGMKFLDGLTEHTAQPELIFSHKWQLHDLIVWDNSCTMHRARPFDDKNQRREMRWCSATERAPV